MSDCENGSCGKLLCSDDRYKYLYFHDETPELQVRQLLDDISNLGYTKELEGSPSRFDERRLTVRVFEKEAQEGMIYSEILAVRREIVDDTKEYFKASLDKFNEFANQVISDNKKSGKAPEKDSDYKGFSFDGIPVICDHTLPPNTIMVGNVSELEEAGTV